MHDDIDGDSDGGRSGYLTCLGALFVRLQTLIRTRTHTHTRADGMVLSWISKVRD